MIRKELLHQMLAHKVIAILRGVKPEEMVSVCEALAAEGVLFMEVPLNTPDALKAIRLAAEHFRDGRVHIGAGTVLKPEDVDAVAEAGGEYIISPNTNPVVIAQTRKRGLLSIPGFSTPTEAFEAIAAGADILKCFPCDSPERIAVLKSVIPLPILAVGGISVKNRDAYLATSDGVGVGIGVYRPGMSPEELKRSTRIFMGNSIPVR